MAISRSLRGREQAKEQSDAASAPSLVTGVHDKDSSTTQPTRDNKQPAIAQTDIAQLQAELAECKNPIRTLQGQLVAQPAASHNDQPATIETAYKAIGQDNPICKISRRKLTNQSLVRPVSHSCTAHSHKYRQIYQPHHHQTWSQSLQGRWTKATPAHPVLQLLREANQKGGSLILT